MFDHGENDENGKYKTLTKNRTMATQAITLMVNKATKKFHFLIQCNLQVVSLESNWKLPVGLLFTDSSIETPLASTIEVYLTKLNSIGIKTISISLDLLSNLKHTLLTQLGFDIDHMELNKTTFKSYFRHPVCGNIYIYFELPPLINHICNCWKWEKCLKHKDNGIYYSFINHVKNLQIVKNILTESEYKKRKIINDWYIIQRRIIYNDNAISKTVADALTYLKDMDYPTIDGCGPTIHFIRVMDCLSNFSNNSIHSKSSVYNMDPNYESSWMPVLENIIAYIKDIRKMYHNDDAQLQFINSIRGIIISLTSLIEIYKNYFKTEKQESLIQYSLYKRLALSNMSYKMSILSIKWSALEMYKRIKALSETPQKIFDDEDIKA